MSRDDGPISRPDLERVHEILDCIEAIDLAKAVVQRHDSDLEVSRMALDAVRYRVAMIGEAVESLSVDLREDHPAVPWSDLARMGDLIGDDDDDKVDHQMVRATIDEPIKRLSFACQAILGESVRIGEDEP